MSTAGGQQHHAERDAEQQGVKLAEVILGELPGSRRGQQNQEGGQNQEALEEDRHRIQRQHAEKQRARRGGEQGHA